MNEKFTKPYDPKLTEAAIYEKWEKSGFFNPDNLPGERKESFSTILPPPNVTGILHMGSALMLVIEDILVRFARMRGKKTLWIPGTDSAAIATQAKVEKEIQKKEGKSRYDLGREELLKGINTFVEGNKNTILSQIRSMGASVDWGRYAYTMDTPRYHAVMTAFVKMYEAGLIYRGLRIVNWDVKGQTTISDDEVVYEERKAKLYTFTYSKDFPIAISTTRPETKVGDTAVAVHPDDIRYKEFIGKEYEVLFCDVPLRIKIVADEGVDSEFGTGALGVTPAHSMIDWEIADRHQLERPQVINEVGKMTVNGRLNGKKTIEAREMVVEWLKAEGVLQKEEDIVQNIPTAERTGGIIEPLPKLQWFIDVDKPFTIPYSELPGIVSGSKTTLKDIMRAAVQSGEVKILPARFEKVYFHWIDNLRDWNISRQIWFGHRIPIWYRGEEIYCGLEKPEGEDRQDSGERWEQDPDVLDTWFSSSLWSFSTLGWPEKTTDLKLFHPTALLNSGYDILFPWVSRMILMSGFHLGQVPFKTVYLHGLVRDEQGRKISKSLGNNIDPVAMGEKYGTDAVRMSLVVGIGPGADSKISEHKIKAYKNFANKLWNISRFVFSNTEDMEIDETKISADTDKELMRELGAVITDVTSDFEEYRFHLAAEKLYHYVWHRFADIIVEESKSIFAGEDENAKLSRQQTLMHILKNVIVMLHPFMPFITEEIWQYVPKKQNKEEELLMIESWPNQ